MKLIIECAEQTYSECKKISGLSETAYVIAHGIPYNPSGDLISRSALKAELEVYRHTRNYKSDEDEAQNNLLDNILEDIDNADAVDLWQMRQEATENALKKAREADRWISVKERMPEPRVAVMVYCPEHKTQYCAFYADKHWQVFGAYDTVWGEVTHWKPLSKEPASEAENETQI